MDAPSASQEARERLAFRRSLQACLAKVGLQGALQADAYQALLQYAEDELARDLDAAQDVVDTLKNSITDDCTVSLAQVQAVLEQRAGTCEPPEPICIVDAFTVPRVRYDAIHKRLVEDTSSPPSLQPGHAAKLRLFQTRFELLAQRLRRSPQFAPLNAVQANLPRSAHAQLVELTGLKGSTGRSCVVMGLISSQDDGSLTIEDGGATLPLDLSHADLAAGMVTEGCIVVAQGRMRQDGVFEVDELGFPGCEPRDALPATAQKLNFFGGPVLTQEQQVQLEAQAEGASDERVVFLANVWLDRAGTFDALHTLFAGFEAAEMTPRLLVFMGNFSSRATAGSADADYLGLRDGFTQLGRLIDTYAAIRDSCQCVFVPGPNDPGLGQVLPQPRLPSYFTAELAAMLPTAVFATNPCRIRFYGREIVAFRYDLTKAMRRRCLMPLPAGVPDEPGAVFGQLARTLLEQSCLCPLPLAVQPVHWAHAQALGLYPLPHALVLADAAPQAEWEHAGCRVFNPGCLQEGVFAAFQPLEDNFEPSVLPGYEDAADAADAADAVQAGAPQQEPC